MKWNWQQKDWPEFKYDKSILSEFELQFLKNASLIQGVSKHLNQTDNNNILVEFSAVELVQSYEIEGEFLNRDSVQSSIRKHFGLSSDNRRVSASENGSTEMINDYYHSFNMPLTHEMLFNWHSMITNGRRDLDVIGGYRKHEEPMQIISGKYDEPTIHFEAPPSILLQGEMDKFICSFNKKDQTNKGLDAIERAAITHLYFETIHPFEDGNGRIGRLLVLKSLSQSLGYPMLPALSIIINKKKKLYYKAFEKSTKSNQINEWMLYFAHLILEAQEYTLRSIEFLIQKTKFFDKFRNCFNERQEKVVKRIFDEGIEGFKGGLSAMNYSRISGAQSATTTRDLQELVEIKAMTKTGKLKGTRYFLNID